MAKVKTSTQHDFMKDYKVQEDSPAKSVIPGRATPLTDEQFYTQVLEQNPGEGPAKEIIKTAILKTRLFQKHVGKNGGSGDAMVDVLLDNGHALLRTRGYEKLKVHQPFSALCALIAHKNNIKLLMQIATGEGKTDISRLVASCVHKLYHDKVDIVTSGETLAMEEVESGHKFYSEVKMKMANGMDSIETMDEHPPHVYLSSDVIVGTASEFTFNTLRDKLNNRKHVHKKDCYEEYKKYDGKLYYECRKGAYLIIDEVDNMFIDRKSSECRIVSGRKTLNKFDLLASLIWTGTQELFDSKPDDVDEAVAMIIQYVEKSKAFEVLKLQEIELERWEACKKVYSQSAYRARFTIFPQEDYIIRGDKITIVDQQNTGELNVGSSWSNYLHTFLEMKHHKSTTMESNCAAAQSLCSFFDYYGSKIFGITGTLGDEHCVGFLHKAYDVEVIRVPKCNKNKMINYAPLAGVTQIAGCEFVSQELLDFCYNSLRMGRPCLVISLTIKEAEAMNNFIPGYLKDRYKKEQLDNPELSKLNFPLNKLKNHLYAYSTEENLRHRVQKISRDTIILGTNLASRGTDITFDGDTNAGGLSVVYTYLPVSSRVEDQIRGRGARNGDNGSNIYIGQDFGPIAAESIRRLLKLKEDKLITPEQKNDIDDKILTWLQKQKSNRTEREAESMRLSYEEVCRLREKDKRTIAFNDKVRELEKIEAEENEKRKENKEKERPEGSRKSVIFRTIMEEKLEIEEIKENASLRSNKREYVARPVSKLIEETMKFITFKDFTIDPRRPEDKIIVDVLSGTSNDDLQEKFDALRKLYDKSGFMQRKNICLAMAIIQNNMGQEEDARIMLETLKEVELEERLIIQTVFRMEKTIAMKRCIDSIVNYCNAHSKEINFNLDKISNDDTSLIIKNSQKISDVMSKLSTKSKEVERAWCQLKYSESIMNQTEKRINEVLEGHFAEYNKLKVFIGGTIFKNLEFKDRGDRKKLVFDVSGDGIGLYGVVAKDRSKGFLGYILGAAMIGLGVACLLFPLILPVVSPLICFGLLSGGFGMIADNYAQNKEGNYSTWNTIKSAFMKIMSAVITPIWKQFLEPVSTWLQHNIGGSEIVKNLLNICTRKSNLFALTIKIMDDLHIDFNKDKLLTNKDEFTKELSVDNLVEKAKQKIEDTNSYWNLFSEFIARGSRKMFTLEILLRCLPIEDEGLVHMAYSKNPDATLEDAQFHENFIKYFSSLLDRDESSPTNQMDGLSFLSSMATEAFKHSSKIDITEEIKATAIAKGKSVLFKGPKKFKAKSFLCHGVHKPFQDMQLLLFRAEVKVKACTKFREESGQAAIKRQLSAAKITLEKQKKILEEMGKKTDANKEQLEKEQKKLEEATSTHNELMNEINSEIEAYNKEVQTLSRAESNRLLANIERKRNLSADTKRKYHSQLDLYNSRIEEWNAKKDEYNNKVNEVNSHREEYNRIVEESNKKVKEDHPLFNKNYLEAQEKLREALYNYLKICLNQLIKDLKNNATQFVKCNYRINLKTLVESSWYLVRPEYQKRLDGFSTATKRHLEKLLNNIEIVDRLRELFLELQDIFHEKFTDKLAMFALKKTGSMLSDMMK